jgi:hypothetical protein
MSKVGSVLLLVGGALLGGWCAMVGLSFSAILLMGFIGTGGREAGGPLAAALAFTVVGCTIGWLLFRAGRRLERASASPAKSNSRAGQPPLR